MNLCAPTRCCKTSSSCLHSNAEGRDVLSGRFDVIVCDGFVGNVLLKFAEAVEVTLQILREELPKGCMVQLGTSLLKP